ncbi:hypothetical protein RSAG8_04314, partial [Rhizoctonia solani AG-8 WAC10335]
MLTEKADVSQRQFWGPSCVDSNY